MPTNYQDQFFQIDPGNPPASGTPLTVEFLTLRDRQDDGFITPAGPGPDDRLDGSTLTAVWPGDTITVVMNGSTVTITGTTFYLSDGRSYFTPTDGTNLKPAVFQSSTYVTSQAPFPVSDLGPPCFAEGTKIETDRGAVAVERLRAGDRLKTLDGGLQPILWVGRSEVAGDGADAPVVFEAGAIGNAGTLTVSPQHRVLFAGWQAELYFGRSEVLIPAKHLVNAVSIRQVPRRRVVYFHVLLPRHHLIRAAGCWSESFFPGDQILKDPVLRAEIDRVVGPAHRYGPLARPALGRGEALALAA